LTPAEVVTAFISEFQIVEKLLVTPNGESRVRNIYAFLNTLRGAGFADTVSQYVYLVENELLDVEIESNDAGANAVKVLTIHAAKGLEFPTVFLFDAGAKFSSEDRRKSLIVDKVCGLCVYSTDENELTKHQTIARLGSAARISRDQIAEEMRLLYVTLTRAKDNLFVVGSGEAYDGARELDDFEILSAKSYFDFIRPAETISAEEIPVAKIKKEQQVLGAKPNKKLVDEFTARFNRPYPFPAAPEMSQKSSVTSLTKSEEEYFNPLPRKSVFEKDRGTEYGTRFHRAMERNAPFDAASEKCAATITELTSGMAVFRELVLLETILQNGEKLLVQGVTDLLAVSPDRAIMVDYKTTHATPDRLVALYKPQLDMYSAAVERAIGKRPTAYIYSTVHGKLIEV
jgi:ATP-dependent exoDNAse (exonuclease V) beta subunit